MTDNETTTGRTLSELDRKYFQPLGLLGTFGRVCTLFSGNWFLFLAINTLANLVVLGLAALFFAVFAGGISHHVDAVGPSLVIELVLALGVQCIADGAIIRAVAGIYAGKTPAIGECIQASAQKLLALLGASFSAGFLIALPAMLLFGLIIAFKDMGGSIIILWLLFMGYAVRLAIYVYVMYPAVIVESKGPIDSLTRSMALVKGNFYYVLCVMFVFGAVKSLVNLLISSLTMDSPQDYNFNSRQLSGYDSFDDDFDGDFDDDFGLVDHSYNKTYFDEQAEYYNNQQYSNGGNGGLSVKFDFHMGGPGDGFLKWIFAILFATIGSILQAVVYFHLVVKKEGWTSAKVSGYIGLEGAPDAEGLLVGHVTASEEYGAMDEKRKEEILA